MAKIRGDLMKKFGWLAILVTLTGTGFFALKKWNGTNFTRSPQSVGVRGNESDAESRKFLTDLLRKMTLEEKAGQLGQATANMAVTGPTGSPRFKEMISSGQVGSVLNSYGIKANRELQRRAIEDTRLKIPLLFGFDVVRGYKTSFPIPKYLF